MLPINSSFNIRFEENVTIPEEEIESMGEYFIIPEELQALTTDVSTGTFSKSNKSRFGFDSMNSLVGFTSGVSNRYFSTFFTSPSGVILHSLPSSVEQWTVEDVVTWLSYLRGLDTNENGLISFSKCMTSTNTTMAEMFRKKKVDGKYLLSLDKIKMRQELNMIQGHIIELESEISFLKQHQGLTNLFFFIQGLVYC